MVSENTFKKVLDHIGYYNSEPTEENVIAAFLDYCDSGAFHGLDAEQAEEDINDGTITIGEICYNLLKL